MCQARRGHAGRVHPDKRDEATRRRSTNRRRRARGWTPAAMIDVTSELQGLSSEDVDTVLTWLTRTRLGRARQTRRSPTHAVNARTMRVGPGGGARSATLGVCVGGRNRRVGRRRRLCARSSGGGTRSMSPTNGHPEGMSGKIRTITKRSYGFHGVEPHRADLPLLIWPRRAAPASLSRPHARGNPTKRLGEPLSATGCDLVRFTCPSRSASRALPLYEDLGRDCL